jgi:hypothetical protein
MIAMFMIGLCVGMFCGATIMALIVVGIIDGDVKNEKI